jgi:hypothetical protein
MPEDQNVHTYPVHGVPMVPSEEFEPGTIRPRHEGRSSAHPVLQCPEPGCTETWSSAPD